MALLTPLSSASLFVTGYGAIVSLAEQVEPLLVLSPRRFHLYWERVGDSFHQAVVAK
jgi:hypothetical protein